MAIQAYTLCPGGTGKKIQFCCKDLQSDLQKIERMVEGEQYAACLQHIENLQRKPANESRACLLAIKGQLLRVQHRADDAVANAQLFVAKHPDNSLAHAEWAIVAAATGDDSRVAMAALQRALELASDGISTRMYEAMSVLAERAVEDNHVLSARALWALQTAMVKDDPHPLSAMIELNRSPQLETLLKEDFHAPPAPEGAAWAAAYGEALAPLRKARWAQAAERLTALTEQQPTAAEAWRTLAMVRAWLTDHEGAVAALRRYAALDVPYDDAVEAEALAILLSPKVLDDVTPTYLVTWTVRDAEKLQETLLSNPRLLAVRVVQSPEADEPPPRGGYVVLDRPALASAENCTLAAMPSQVAQVLFYGKQTDREARIEVSDVGADQLAEVKQFVQSLGGDALEPDAKEEAISEQSASIESLRRRWHPPRDLSQSQYNALLAEFERTAVLERWPQVKLGLLGGRSVAEAAGDPACRTLVSAVVLVFESWYERGGGTFDIDQLRRKLGLPEVQPIDPQQRAAETVPLVRLHLVMVEKLSDDELVNAFRRAAIYSVSRALRRFAHEIVNRPSLATHEERLHAYAALARTARSAEESLQYVDAGRKVAEAAGQSCASWDLWELGQRFGQRDGQRALELIRHIERRHLEEPGIAEALNQLLVDVGILRPDGTPNLPTGESPALGEAAAGPGAPAGAAPQGEPGGIWTPDSQQSGGGKLWIPE